MRSHPFLPIGFVMLARPVSLTFVLTAAVLVGCRETKTVDPAVVEQARAEFLLAEEPTGAVTPAELREEEGFTAGEVTLVGQIGGIPNPWKGIETDFPWRGGEASLFLVDPGTAGAFAEHSADDPDHAENCPFCSSNAGDNADAVAVVTFRGANGETIPVGAKELLALKDNAVVVVRGDARLDGDTLIVDAQGIYVRK